MSSRIHCMLSHLPTAFSSIGPFLFLAVTTYPVYFNEPQDCVDWLLRAREPGFEFLKGAHQNGFYLGVFCTKQDHLAFCSRDLRHDLGRTETELAVVDGEGRNLIAFGEKKRAISRVYSRQSEEPRMRSTWIENYGYVYPLTKGHPRGVRVIFKAKSLHDDEFLIIFDEIVEFPGNNQGITDERHHGEGSMQQENEP